MTITLDGTLADWSALDRLETPDTSMEGYALYGRFENGAFVVAVESAIAIGPDTTFWLNTDGDSTTGHQVWGWAAGAEFNINFGADGIPRLYTGAEGESLIGEIEYALSADRTTLEMRLPQALFGAAAVSMAIFADINNLVFLPANYGTSGYMITPEPESSFDGLLTEWGTEQRLDVPGTGMEGYALYGRVDPENFVLALQSGQPIGAGTTFWLNTDGDANTGHKIWGWAAGAEFNVYIGTDGIARLYSGAAGETFVSDLDFKIGPEGTTIELAIPKAVLGSGIEQIAVLSDINDAVFLPNNFGYGGYTLAVPPVSAFDGILSEWTPEQRIETSATHVEGYELYGAVKNDAFVIALKSDIDIGSGTTFWLNADGDVGTGHLVWGWAAGAEFNVNIGEDGRARLYTGDAGQTFVADLDFAIGPDGKTLELAIPKALLGTGINTIGVMADVNDTVHLPTDYTQPAYTITDADPESPAGPASYKIAIVYSQSTAAAYWSEMAYSQLLMAAQSQAMSAGIPYDLIGEGDLTNLAKLSQYSALVFPSFRNAPANYADIAATLTKVVHDHNVSIIAAGDFMTNAANGDSLPGNAYERMQSLLGLTRSGGESSVDINLVTTGTNDITAGYTDGSIRSYTGAATSYFSTLETGAGTVFAQQVVNGVAHDAVISTTTGGRNVHFATEAMLADNNLLGKALDWATQTLDGPKVSLSMSRDTALVASRNDMDQSQETFDIDGGIYDAMLPILEQWKADYNFVGSYYVNVGLNPPDQTTNWFISSAYYNQLLAMGNEIGSHSYTHPADTNFLLPDTITDAQLDAYIAAVGDLLDPDLRAALDVMTAAQFMARLQSGLLAPDPLALDAVGRAVLEASFTFQFLASRQTIEANLGIIASGAAVPGMPETIETARQIIQYYDYLSGGASMVGAGYPGAFGFLTPNETEKVYIAPNMSFDFTLMGWLGLTPEEAKAKWLAEFNELTINADLPILVWPWHDYGPTSWDIDGSGTSNYSLAMFTSFLEAAHAKGAEFVTLADLTARISTFEKTELSYKVNGDTITVTATPQLGTLGTFAVNLDSLGTQTIASVANWYAYDGNSVFLDADGGSFEIKLGAVQADVTRITSIGARIQLLSLSGDGSNLAFTMYGEGLVTVDLNELAGYDFNISGAHVVSRNGDIVTLKLGSLGTHTVSLVRQDTINVAPTDLVVSNLVAIPENDFDRIKVADLLVVDPNIYAHLRNNTVTVSDDRFEIDPVDGGLYRKAGVAFDFETLSELALTLTVSDGQFPAITRIVTVQIANVNEGPTGAVTITGVTVENQTLLADTSTLTDPEGIGELSYQWQRDTGVGFADIGGANAASYTLTDADSTARVRVVVSYTDAGGTAESIASEATAPITDVNNAPVGSALIAGNAVENQILVADISTLADADGLGVLSYQWQRDTGSGFADIPGATAISYTLTNADAFNQVRVVIGYTDARGAVESVISPATGPVIDVNNAPTGAVLITGAAIEQKTLVADTSSLADADGIGAFSYQWQRNTGSGFANIAGATAISYTLTAADSLALVRVVIRYVDAGGAAESITSASTAPVASVSPTIVLKPLIEDMTRIIAPLDLAGSAYAGTSFTIVNLTASSGKLTANTDGTWTYVPKLNDDTGVTFSYTIKMASGTKSALATLDLLPMTDVMGTAGDDVLTGRTTADQYHGLAGNDVMRGGAGNDIFFGGAGNDTIYGDAGNDIAFGDSGNDTFVATLNDGNDSYTGGTGTDTIDFSAITVNVTVNLKTGKATSSQTGTDTLATIENVIGGKGNDTITGSSGTNVLSGGAGNDTIRGDAGNDTIRGGAGNDILYGDAGNDTVFGDAGDDIFIATIGDGNDSYTGGTGIDTIDFSAITANATINLATGKATSSQTGTDTLATIENVIGGKGNDTITGSAGANVLTGGAGNDVIKGGAGNDRFVATINDGNDTYWGEAGTDIIDFSAISSNVTVNLSTGKATSNQTGTDTLATIENVIGGKGNDTITGSSGANVLSGGLGNDRIEGLGGRDTLTGGAGSDIFIFKDVTHSRPGVANRDVITDFTKGADRIDLSGIDANTSLSGNQAFTFLATAGAAFTGKSGQLIFTHQDRAGTADDRTIISADINGDRISDFSIELIGIVKLTAADFIL